MGSLERLSSCQAVEHLGVHRKDNTNLSGCPCPAVAPSSVLSLQMVLGGAQLFQSQQDLLHRTSPLLLSYFLIRWASQCLASDVPVDTL